MKYLTVDDNPNGINVTVEDNGIGIDKNITIKYLILFIEFLQGISIRGKDME